MNRDSQPYSPLLSFERCAYATCTQLRIGKNLKGRGDEMSAEMESDDPNWIWLWERLLLSDEPEAGLKPVETEDKPCHEPR